MTQIPRVLRPADAARPAPSLFDVLGALAPASRPGAPPRSSAAVARRARAGGAAAASGSASTSGPARAPRPETGAPFRAALVLEVARRNRPSGPPRPTPHGAVPPAAMR